MANDRNATTAKTARFDLRSLFTSQESRYESTDLRNGIAGTLLNAPWRVRAKKVASPCITGTVPIVIFQIEVCIGERRVAVEYVSGSKFLGFNSNQIMCGVVISRLGIHSDLAY